MKTIPQQIQLMNQYIKGLQCLKYIEVEKKMPIPEANFKHSKKRTTV